MIPLSHAVLSTAERLPRAVAIADPVGGDLTYADLASAVAELARTLVRDVPPGRRVAVLTSRTPRTVVRMLACLHAGRAYVPLDPAAPAARRRFVVEDAECALLLADDPRDGDPRTDPDTGLPVRSTLGDDVGVPAAPDPAPTAPGHEAYVLYTSGSTGSPKGVVITHRNAGAFVGWAARAFPLGPGDQVAVHAPLHFDLPVYDVFVGLTGGATLHLVGEREVLFPQALLRFLHERRVSHLYAVPSALTALVQRSTLTTDGLPHLRRLLYAGEEFRAPALRTLMLAVPQAVVANLYGPIETNVVTSHVLSAPPDEHDRVPIGRAVDGALVGVLDDAGTLHLEGIAEGELVVGGDCVTPGYLHRPDLTAATRALGDGPDGPVELYRTGDLARRDAQGLLHLLGRRDGMVKTRGFRVELGEIEAVLGASVHVAEVAVIPRPDPDLTHRLVALVVAAGPWDAAVEQEVLAHCRSRLAGYMVPAELVVVADLPRTSTGKVARAALGELVPA